LEERYGASTPLLKIYLRGHMLKGELPKKKEGRKAVVGRGGCVDGCTTS
jgi:hypothetical protein